MGATGLFASHIGAGGDSDPALDAGQRRQVYLVESPAIPMVDVQIDFDAGSRRDPAAQAGLASVTAGMLAKACRRAGRPSRAGRKRAGRSLGRPGRARLAPAPAADRMSFSLRSLTDPDLLDKAVALAARQIGRAGLSRGRLAARARAPAGRAQGGQHPPGHLAGRAFAQAVYGSHPYGYEMTEATLARISVADMQAAACRRRGRPAAPRVSMVGAVTRAQADALADAAAVAPARSCRAPACAPLPAVPEVAPLAQAAGEAHPV